MTRLNSTGSNRGCTNCYESFDKAKASDAKEAQIISQRTIGDSTSEIDYSPTKFVWAARSLLVLTLDATVLGRACVCI